MNITDTFQFWGLSDCDETVKNFITSNYFNKIEVFIGDKDYHNTKYTAKLSFKTITLYRHYYFEPKKVFTRSHEEAFFIGFSIGDFYGKPNFPFALPYNLTFNDSYAEVKSKLKIRSSKLKRIKTSSYCQFNFDHFSLLAYFSLDDKLIYLVFSLFEKSTLDKKELQTSFKTLDKKIDPANTSLLTELKKVYPAFEWQNRLDQGDTTFTKAAIETTSKILSDYIDELTSATNKTSSRGVYSATKKAVKSLNKANKTLGHFIDTLEREELCHFIEQAVSATGFELKKGFDITEEWREW